MMPIRLSEPSYKSLFVEVISEGGGPLGTATSFVAQAATGAPFLLTNRHVVTGRHQDTDELISDRGAVPGLLNVWFNSTSGRGHWTQVQIPLYSDGIPIWIEHSAYGKSLDVVAIPLPEGRDDLRIEPYEALPFQHDKMEPAQMLSVVGFPFGERTGQSFAVWATGFVATEPDIDHGGKPIFLIDCRSRPGQSGSPVILHHGYHAKAANSIGFQASSELLGIYSGRINEQSDLGRVWKSSMIVELLLYANALRQR
jgi:Trypsin-like peptidase domain